MPLTNGEERPLISLLADDAIAGRSQDRFEREAFAARIVELFNHVAVESESAVFGLMGPWGSGKTSVLRLMRASIDPAEAWQVVEFNPWQLSDLTSVTREFFVTVTSALPKGGPGKRARAALAAYTRKIAPFTSVLSVAGIDPSKAIEAAGDALAGETSLETQRKEIEDALRKQTGRILVLIDDVDRLQADELSLVLKLVRLVGRLPNVYYLLAFDETTILDVLQLTQVAAGDRARALAYLDKIIQVRLDMPPAHPLQVSRLVDSALAQVVEQYAIVITDADITQLSRVYHEHMAGWLTEPRHVKRYFGQVDALLSLVRDEVNFIDFLLVTFLRTFFPDAYRILRHFKAELTGTAFLDPRKETTEAVLKRWRERMIPVTDERTVDVVLNLLGELFVPIGSALRNMGAGTYRYAEMSAARRVGSAEYFDRYFYFMIPPNDISDVRVKGVIEEVVAGNRTALAEGLVDQISKSGEAIVDKLARFSPTDPASTRRLLPFAAEIERLAPDTGLLGRTRAVASMWFSGLLAVADLGNPQELMDELLSVADLADVAAAVRDVKRRRDEEEQQLTPNELELRDLTVGRIREALTTQATLPVDQTVDVRALLWLWAELAGPAEPRTWLRTAAVTHPWTLEQVVALFVKVGHVVGTDARILSGLDVELLEELFGVDDVLSAITLNAGSRQVGWHEQTDGSFGDLQDYSHGALGRLAKEKNRGADPDVVP